MTDPRPAPFPPTTKANGWRFEIDLEKVEQSDTWALASVGPPELRPWLLMLWVVAWKQVPCGSLPADDELIVARLGMPPELFRQHRRVLMRSWWMADDGRLYCNDLLPYVNEMIAFRQSRGYLKHKAEVIARCGAGCWYCGRADVELTLDHVQPQSRGGSHDPLNLVPACRCCNSSKGARTPEEWRAAG